MTFLRRCSLALAAALLAAGPASARELRVCADPNNLPFSDRNGGGFENKIVDLLAHDLGASVTYTWWAQRRGFIRNTLNADSCDLVAGVPSNYELLRTTAPYYRSTYVFLTRADGPQVSSFDDPALRRLKIGVQLVGDANETPAEQALSRRGLRGNIRSYRVNADYDGSDGPERMVKAVADGEIDLAVLWGPVAGYFAKRQQVPMRIVPVQPQYDGPRLPMVFDISMGVRKQDDALLQEIDGALLHHHAEIERILADYGVPQADSQLIQIGAKP